MTDSRIVTSTYRYKRPPRKRKAVPLAGPAIVSTKSSRRPVWEKAAAEATPVPEGSAAKHTARGRTSPRASSGQRCASR